MFPYKEILVTVLLPHQAFHWPFLCQQWLDFNTIHEFTFIISFINPTHCCTLTKPNYYIAMLVYKPKKHSKQYTDLKYVIYIEMTD